MQQKDYSFLTDEERLSLELIFKPYARAKGMIHRRPVRLKMLSHLIGRDVRTSRQVYRHEYEYILNLACPGWQDGNWTHTPAFAVYAAKLAAGYAVVAAQEAEAREATPRRREKVR